LLDGDRLGGPGSTGNLNFAYFNDPVHNASLDAATALTGGARLNALGGWDVETARNSAPWAPYMVLNDRHFFSDRLGCHTYVPAYGISLGALCLRGPPAASPPPPGPPPPPPAAPPPPPPPLARPSTQARCVVPNVKGKTVPAARTALRRRRCALGRVDRAYSARMKKNRVISQSRRPGARLRRGARVNVVVSRGRRR
jgi:hypothetical protein